jgi:signal transduction histidine kinase
VIGSFGLLWFALSVRNVFYYHPDVAPIGPVTTWLFYVLQVLSVPLVAAFAMALSGRRPRWYLRLLVLVALALPAGAVLAAASDQMPQLRRWTYPMLVLLYLPALWLMFGATRGVRLRHLFPVAAGLALAIAAGTHDLVYSLGLARLGGRYLLPFVMPLAMAVFAWNLMRRMVHGLVRTERQKDLLERRVAERTHELQEANAAKGRFIAAASHDLRQPVVALGLMTGLLRDDPEGPGARRVIDKLHDAARTLERLVHGLLDLSRLDAGAAPARLAPVDLAALFEAVAGHEGEAARAKGLRFRVRPGAPTVMSDPVLLEQVVRNLASNAVRYTHRGGVVLAARRRAGGRVLVQVWDTGRGIAPHQQQAVFEEFVRVGPGLTGDALAGPGDTAQGVGLGLAIARRAATALGATLALRSQPGRGSCFTLDLPDPKA